MLQILGIGGADPDLVPSTNIFFPHQNRLHCFQLFFPHCPQYYSRIRYPHLPHSLLIGRQLKRQQALSLAQTEWQYGAITLSALFLRISGGMW